MCISLNNLGAHLCVLGEFISNDVVNGEDDLDVPLLRLCDQARDLFRSWSIEERIANLEEFAREDEFQPGLRETHRDSLQSLLEGECHSSADDQRVDLRALSNVFLSTRA